MQPQVAKTYGIQQLDESTFQQILQAAYIIQKQNDSGKKLPTSDPAASLAVIAETQRLLRSQDYDVGAAANLVIQRLGTITDAKGIAVALIDNNRINYCAGIGILSSLSGQTEPLATEVSEFLRAEEGTPGSEDNDSQPFGTRDNSSLFFPVFHDGRIAAVLQLASGKSDSTPQEQIRSCQLMAGLMGDSISRAAEQSLANERARMLEALERLRPQLERLAAEPIRDNGSRISQSSPEPKPLSAEPLPVAVNAELTTADEAQALLSEPELPKLLEQILTSTCTNCGSLFCEGEKYCGKCGHLLSIEAPAADDELSATATPESPNEADPSVVADQGLSQDPIQDLPPVVDHAGTQFANDAAAQESTALSVAHQVAEPALGEDEKLELAANPTPPEQLSPWSSAKKARAWLHSMEPHESGWFAKHIGDISIITAGLVLLLVAVGSNSRPVQGKLQHPSKTPTQPSLTLVERLLVGLGVAEAPAAPVHLGNPNVQVWEDLHTGLYYCPGADLYGKTLGGKLTNQRDAQLDQFEPAARRTCD